ncbi:hypothetical protein [Gordonia sp. VNK21]|uniref:hypothetical protein n=1 Tax=Gordonia sp. VNK21 TaxID=3382483 RepID=UPI0038D3603F
MNTFQKGARAANRLMAPALRLPGLRGLLGRSMAEISYTGRRSGKRFSLVVAYRRRGDEVLVAVALPDQKTWWRNFEPEPGPITITLDGVERTGTAVATRTADGTRVRIVLDPQAAADAP